MIAIRGATTVLEDTPQAVEQATNELLTEIINRNHLDMEDVVFVLFSTTSDIQSAYPAAAARKIGFTDCALYSSMEPDINNALKLCIRVMIMSDIVLKKSEINHVYLREAANLRKDLQKYAIALDGPAGSGKSTIAKLLAASRDILYLDTGAMYRACGLFAIRSGLDYKDGDAVEKQMPTLCLDVKYLNGEQHTFLGEEDVSSLIRTPEVSMAASCISAHKCVRLKMVELQREIAKKTNCVLDGRDIGSFVLPDAKYKFFVTASVDVRAKRRYDEMIAKGIAVDYDTLKAEIELRDKQDSTREFAPLVQAKDAIVVDTSDMTIAEVLEKISSYLE
jgi:cytidylate kinase